MTDRQKRNARARTSRVGRRGSGSYPYLCDLSGRTILRGQAPPYGLVARPSRAESKARKPRKPAPPPEGKNVRALRARGAKLPNLAASLRARGVRRFERSDSVVELVLELTDHARIINEANRSRHEHWAATARRVRSQRDTVGWALAWLLPCSASEWPAIHVAITRLIGPRGRAFDSDGLIRALKAVRDGAADACGLDDGSNRYFWEYQEHREDFHGVRIVVRKCETACMLSRGKRMQAVVMTCET